MNKTYKKLAKHVVNFESVADLEAVVLAKLGMSTAAICERTALTKHQVTYRLSKGKGLEGYGKGHTYRSEWRDGSGSLAQGIMQAMLPQLRKETKAVLPKLVQHPTPETTKKEPHSNSIKIVEFGNELPPEVKKIARMKV